MISAPQDVMSTLPCLYIFTAGGRIMRHSYPFMAQACPQKVRGKEAATRPDAMLRLGWKFGAHSMQAKTGECRPQIRTFICVGTLPNTRPAHLACDEG